ncbi:acyl-CoA thioester hydrolase [Paenibacillus anaericanus]|uniref:Acyl-CoA thioesterase n=1 Tax=Paenibacillus anaericanus TaxID=170367 RepID=A0A3S1BS50_9BACL|nr:thioesterase family protein [Paenibacillus anaericanus]MDQ0086999.1 acyl-CoA thioester hydrolase [Paenibacillus anaericanus]RUT46144.1 acyl-CoA thioesterase [Paenibacillus anaericanus]
MFVSELTILPKYSEFDMMGIIYHANYLGWFEMGRTKLCQDLGFEYFDMEQAGYISPVHEMKVEYKRGITYGDRVLLRTWIRENGGVKTVYGYEVVDGNGIVRVEGTSSHYVVRKEDFKPVQFKKVFPEWYAAFEEASKF